MRIFLYEHVTGGGMSGSALPASLAREGWAMLKALLDDLARLPGASIVTMLDRRYSRRDLTRDLGDSGELAISPVGTAAEAEREFDRCAKQSDAVLIIAPESEEVLLKKTQRASELGATILGSPPAAIALTGDKLGCARHLLDHSVPVVPAAEIDIQVTAPFPPPWVLKPRLGAGSTDTLLVEEGDAAAAKATAAEDMPTEDMPDEDMIVTPHVAGRSASVLCIVGRETILPLLPGLQQLSDDGRFRYLGGKLPLTGHEGDRAVSLARRAIDTVSGLAGFVGVDLILGNAADGSGDKVVEINPRLTTSYVGLRALARDNLAGCCVDLLVRGEASPPTWNAGEIVFTPDGEVSWNTVD